MNNRNQLLDLMRFFAAFGVVFFHLNESITYIDNPYRHILKLGYVGVPIFFVISGYCIIFSANRSANWADFMIRRFFRIYPPYLFSLAVTLLVIFVLKQITGFNSVATLPKTWSGILPTLLLMTSPITQVPGTNWVYWTLTLEAIFYSFAGISRLLPYQWRLLFFVALSVFGWLLPVGDTGVLAVFKYWPIFSIGVAGYYIQRNHQLLLALFLIALNFGWLIDHFLLAGEAPYWYASLFAVIVLILSFKYEIKKNWLSTAGDYSYSVYLLHVPIGVYLMGSLKTPAIQTHVLGNLAFDTLCYLITLGLAYLAFKWVELPAIALGKNMSRWQQKEKLKVRQDVDAATDYQ